MIKEMAFVAYSVRDVPKAREFYRDVVGLTPSEMFGDHWAEFSVGSTTFGIGNGEPLGIMPGTSFAATFEVDDVAAERKRLADRGVAVTDINESPMCWSVFVTDPEGNRFGLHQRK
ncbi:lactoylglutathione lyase [Vulcanimicrobium alpinum]|uniref:Lactoylglutathione lyase n=1 Tax=Vulcanimicrobium alpinum TaxID=3016050 RepID=A0AAN1XZX9_UNVUL|nr:VOC family protein [Vulcanimicrobium alpinum]BDE08064.1 lactoylglutathione lyase [Vulcanimicrobium alpinum]